ncbi:hypothetical protein ABEB36_000645 [Hypothenemus hampei]|uniref:Uncharacterized protein n=1 Tax=Hypothenemus hampei TaxID=57062 RepID=A0ABD1FBZ8_HYPHA
MTTKSSAIVILELCVPQFSIEPFTQIFNTSLLQLKTTEIFVNLHHKFEDISGLDIDDMEQEFKNIINSLSFKVESFVLYLGVCSSVTVTAYLYDVLFYEDRLMLQSFFNKGFINT